MLINALLIIAVMVGVGIIFGVLLAYFNSRMAVEKDPLIEAVDDVLPKGQCGACGYPGCTGYAEAVVKNPDVPVNLCVPGKEAVAKKIAELTGKMNSGVEHKIAHVMCAGTYDRALRTFEYKGIRNCVSANLLQGGNKACKYGCIGLGTCVVECQFGALTLGKDGIPVVNSEKCTGCGKCKNACPKGVIEMVPVEALVHVDCHSQDKGAVSRKKCSVSCLGCGACARACPYGAISIENNLARVNYAICIEKCDNPVCTLKCPTKAINTVVSGVKSVEDLEEQLKSCDPVRGCELYNIKKQ
jgi:Na+-translocating ferredoxin:NAD+ oxidoreductase subunit B